MSSSTPRPQLAEPVFAIVGPTGSGKSAVAMALAERLVPRGEIVAVDAFTVYRGMDVGTAKPPPADRARVPHHMVDLLEPEQDCTVQWFQERARAAISEVQQRGGVPVLVGGSGLYFRAVVDPLEFPPTEPRVRDRLDATWRDDPAAAHRELAAVDPAAAAKIDPGNLRRTVRALEVIELSGRQFSSFATAWGRFESVYPGLQVIGLDVPREELSALLAMRTEAMLDDGWLEEARALQDRQLSSTAAQAIGYAELWAHLAGEMAWEDAVERIVLRTRQYAIRQLRWFRSDPRVVWEPPEKALEVEPPCTT